MVLIKIYFINIFKLNNEWLNKKNINIGLLEITPDFSEVIEEESGILNSYKFFTKKGLYIIIE